MTGILIITGKKRRFEKEIYKDQKLTSNRRFFPVHKKIVVIPNESDKGG